MRYLSVIVLIAIVCGAAAGEDGDPKTKTLLWVGGPIHDAKGIGDVLEEALEGYGRFDVTRVDGDLDAFLPERLEGYEVVVFFNTLGEIREDQKRGIMNFVASGRGIVGFHSAADSFRGDPDWDALFSGHFRTHPAYRTFQVSVLPTEHPVTAGMKEFLAKDEQYIMSYDSRVKVLCAGITPEGEWMPAAWAKDWGKGKVFYTTLGHDPAACRNENFQRLILRGTLWAAGKKNLEPAR